MRALTPADRILLAAESLIAERGIGASLQDIASEAGQRNKSAVQYYFRTRDGMIAAAVNARLAEMESSRMQLLADAELAGTDHDLRALIRMLVLPMIQIVDGADSTHFARFFDRVRHHPAIDDEINLWDQSHPALRIIIGRISRNLDALPADVRRFRTDSMATCLLALMADYERVTGSLDADARARRADELVDVLVRLVTG